MEQRRFLLFIVLSMLILIGWQKFGIPFFFPRPPQPVAKDVDKDDAQKDDEGDAEVADKNQGDKKKDDSADNENEPPVIAKADPNSAELGEAEKKPEEAVQPKNAAPLKELEKFPSQEIAIGSLNPKSGYFLQATLDSRGAALKFVELNDDRYKELDDPQLPLKLLGDSDDRHVTFATEITQVDKQLEKHETSLSKVDWELIDPPGGPKQGEPISSVTFRYTSPDGLLEVSKKYSVNKIAAVDVDTPEIRDYKPTGYEVGLELTVKNLGDNAEQITYIMQGPAGIPLENALNTRKYRDVKMEYFTNDQAGTPLKERSGNAETITAATIAEEEEDNEPQVWKSPLRYIGVDVQYFTTLLFPVEDQLKTRTIAEVNPQVLGLPKKHNTDISFSVTSEPLDLRSGKSITHAYKLFVGPKRESLLQPIGAEQSLDFGWFGFVSKPMLLLLKFLHNLGIPYGIAIIILTICVRGCMYPISRKQAKGAMKMKELQPKIAELKKKYANQKEKMAKAQMELFSKHNYNPFAGCLPIFLQFPIFIGLYQALGNAVDLRAAKFLWVDNLAAPDAMFPLGFAVPFVGWTVFNLLPIITICLFILQQKMFMPPAAPDDEQAKMQQKMMKYMMVVMGFMFYTVPAGLCVYFISSSLWGMGERKLLDIQKARMKPDSELSEEEGEEQPNGKNTVAKQHGKKNRQEDEKPKSQGLWARLVASAETAAEQSKAKTNGTSRTGRDSGGSKKKKKKRSRR